MRFTPHSSLARTSAATTAVPADRPVHGSAACLTRFLMASLLAGLAAPIACDTPAEPDRVAPQVAVLSPRDGSSVADSVTVVLEATDDQGVETVTLWVDDLPAGSCSAPPWEVVWDTGGLPDSSFHNLRAEARDAAGNLGRSPDSRICVRQNGSPSVRILWPPDAHWANLDQPQTDWRCAASDPDEGALGDDRIVWFVDGIALLTTGAAIPPPEIIAGTHEIRVQVADRWGRSAIDRHELHAFRYPEGNTPSELLEIFWLAIRSRDSRTAADCLSNGFAFMPPVPGAATRRWGPARQQQALQQLLDGVQLEQLEVTTRADAPEQFLWEGRAHAKIELRDFSLAARLACGSSPGENDPLRDWEIRASAGRIFLRATDAAAGGRIWKLVAWWDLHAAHGCSGEGHSWADLLTAAYEQRLCE